MSEVIETDHTANILGWIAGIILAAAIFMAGYYTGSM